MNDLALYLFQIGYRNTALAPETIEENFPRQNDYRNRILAEAMKTLGYVNKY